MRSVRLGVSFVSLAVLVFAVLITARPVSAHGHHGHGKPRKPAPSKPGKFDYYVLSLSWSPEHCAEKPSDDSQCGTTRRYAFVVHGLWPQYENGGYPQNCSVDDPLTDGDVQKALDIMPSEDLIRHEWQKHGTCSGLSPTS
jgi:ribonuclease T2